MLQLKNIVKTYATGELNQHALKGINVSFRDNEFVSILGQSGSGKTTMLNIIGGLDRYNSGDLIINGVSTEEYDDADWDIYRNHSVGFIFQSYNLIPHQTVLSNVEMALTLAGVSKKERRERAVEVLKKVGLEAHIHKKPNQMSGGQMQRVAIARALINNPDILLADEPTGALDSETSVQIMELLKEIAKDKLVIMVTHNPELAQQYSTRIVRLLDGQIISDTDPYIESVELQSPEKKKRISMSFLTALSLSFNNLKTKKGRTFLTSMAGSIGIIGIGLVLAISTGMTEYIDSIQRETMSSYPITINSQAIDSGTLYAGMGPMQQQEETQEVYSPRIGVYSDFGALEAGNRLTTVIKENDLGAFKTYLDNPTSNIHQYLREDGIVYGYDIKYSVYTRDPDGKLININDDPHLEGDASFSSSSSGSFIDALISGGFSYGSTSSAENFSEMAKGTNNELINPAIIENYDVLYGVWPQQQNQVVLVLDGKNSISLEDMFQLGLITNEKYNEVAKSIKNSQTAEPIVFDYGSICQQKFYLVTRGDHYINDGDGTYTFVDEETGNETALLSNALEIEISAVVQRKPDVEGAYIAGPIAYTNALKNYIIDKSSKSAVSAAQIASPDTNVLNGMKFEIPDDQAKISATKEYLASLSESEKASIYKMISLLNMTELLGDNAEGGSTTAPSEPSGGTEDTTEESFFDSIINTIEEALNSVKNLFELLKTFGSGADGMMTNDSYFAGMLDDWLADSPDEGILITIYDQYITESTYDENLSDFGYVNYDKPTSISLYSDNFENKDAIAACIEEYNNSVGKDSSIAYTDYVAMLTSSLTSIINGISYVLVAFVAISLFVSCIMIGIITHISVMERTKEIGILRALGASKMNISQVFNAETFIIGCCSGLFGIFVSLLCLIPINSVIEAKTGIENLDAQLHLSSLCMLIMLSIVITIVGGLIPSVKAAKKDPVEALRTE